MKGEKMKWLVSVFVLWGAPAMADPVDDIANAARAAFDRMPMLQRVDGIAGQCGADETVNSHVAYCTSRNTVYVARATANLPQSAYLVAHAYGHAVQVQHGVADVALAQIRARRNEEEMLRGLVERQVDCIAGFLVARAGLADAALTNWFSADPLSGAHWGRDPLRVGPRVSVTLAARNDWFQRGQGGDLAACAPGEFGADLLLDALNP